jgi:hypothetical protein
MKDLFGPKGILQHWVSTLVGVGVLCGLGMGIYTKLFTFEQVWPAGATVLPFFFYKGKPSDEKGGEGA